MHKVAAAENCPICHQPAPPCDVVDFNKNCEENRGRFLPPSGIPIHYHRCPDCGFCFAPDMMRWTNAEFKERVYNDTYQDVDPDYSELRPKGNAQGLENLFGKTKTTFTHLDFGGGNGLLSRHLCASGWTSDSFDPFVDGETSQPPQKTYDLITAFEVFEHVPNPHDLLSNLRRLLKEDGVILFSTLLSDSFINTPRERLNWWYAAPRNGHISLYSKRSLEVLCNDHGFRFGSFNAGFHAAFRSIPHWARDVIKI